MTEQGWDLAEKYRVIASRAKATRPLLIMLPFVTVVGGLITLTAVAKGGWTTVSARFLGTGLVMLAPGFVYL
jgi:hypothetical protein